VALTSCLVKLMEHTVKTRMEWVLDRSNFLYKGQYGFRPGRSTTEALVRLENEIQCALANKKKTLAVFLDMSRVFYRVWWPAY
jgi:Reverse transcriptase (RNA-dependent DNA polymerase)